MYILFILFSFYSANISQRVFHVVFPFPHSPSLRLCSVISNGTRLHLPVSRLLKISDCCFCCCCWLLFIFGAHQKPTLHFQFRNIAWSLVWVWFAWLFLSFFLFFSFVFFFRLFFSAIAGIPLYMWRGTFGIIVLSNNFSCYFHTHARARQWKAALNGENAQRAQPAKNKKKQTRHTQMLVWRSTKKTKKKAIGKSARGATPPKSSEKTKKKW